MQVIEDAAEPSETAPALRLALAATICTLLAERWHLEFGYMAVVTAHMIMAKYDFTIFQKGIERIVGRAVGIGYGLVLLNFFHNAPLLVYLLMLLAMLFFFYVHLVGRLAYTFLNCGLYLAVIVEIGHNDPAAAPPAAAGLMLAVVIGIVVADLVNWITDVERDLHIQPGGKPLLPIRLDCLNHSAMLIVAVMLTQFTTRWLALPTSQAVVSVMMLAITADVNSLVRKAELRFVGAFLAAAWGLGSFWLLNQVPHVPLLLALVFLGMFLAGYLARAGKQYSYAGLQMGLVLPMVLVVPPSEFGSIDGALNRIKGIVAALLVTTAVGVLWPNFGGHEQAG